MWLILLVIQRGLNKKGRRIQKHANNFIVEKLYLNGKTMTFAALNIIRSFHKYKRQICPCHHILRYKTKVNLTYIRHYAKKAKETKPEDIPMEKIRNFCIIAHVDHGKSTLADRLLEITGAIDESKENKQVLDRLPVERERGITVKSVAASLRYETNGVEYCLNLIDTPGHVDFCNEVTRSLAACQGAVLLIDSNDGVQAQTVANFYLAFTMELTIISALNKIDLQNAKPEKVEKELKNLFDIEPSTVLRISGKTGQGVHDLLDRIVQKIPPPGGDSNAPFRALLIDSWHEDLRGAVCFVCVVDGEIKVGDEITSFTSKKNYAVRSLGILTPEERKVSKLSAGQVGIISCNMKNLDEAIMGDTLHAKKSRPEPLKSFEPAKQMIFSGLFPKNQSEHEKLKGALKKLCLNDPSVSIELESSPALGYGWRLGFLGLLHLDVFRQRLEQEFGAETILTSPSVPYKVKVSGAKAIKKYGGTEVEIKNPLDLPDENVVEISEPYVTVTIFAPMEFYQSITEECLGRRGELLSSTCLDDDRIFMKYSMPLSEVIIDFHDKLKSLSSGYASFDYEDSGFRVSDLKKLIILINKKEVDELVTLVHVTKARSHARKIVEKLKELIPRQQVSIAIQAAIEGKIIARDDIKPYRKDVTAKLYGGDVTRRMKLLQNQAEGKKKMRAFFNIQIPRDTFADVLRAR